MFPRTIVYKSIIKQILRFKQASNKLPVMPSTVSSIGSMCTRFPYLTSWHWWTETTSPSRTLKFFLTTLFIRIFGSSHVSSASTIQIVSFLFLPCYEVIQDVSGLEQRSTHKQTQKIILVKKCSMHGITEYYPKFK
jgi:hypothetical protein